MTSEPLSKERHMEAKDARPIMGFMEDVDIGICEGEHDAGNT